MSGSALKRALDPRTRDRSGDGSAKKKPSRHASAFTLRWLMFAEGDPDTVGTRSPGFAEVFTSIFDSISTSTQWVDKDMAQYCQLAMMTMFWLKHRFAGTPVAAAAAAEADDEDYDDAASDTDSAFPTGLKPKLVNIVISLNDMFNVVDGGFKDKAIEESVEYIDLAKAKFRYAFRFVTAASSKKAMETSIHDAVIEFASSSFKENTWQISGEPITVAAASDYFKKSEAVIKASRRNRANGPQRQDSMYQHAVGTHDEVKQIKECLMTLAEMVSVYPIVNDYYAMINNQMIYCV